jgi:hypothetical protein
MKLPVGIIALLVGSGVHQQSSVTLCDLLRSPEKHNGEEVRVRATYRYGFEVSQLYCLDCADKGKVWLQIPTDLGNASERSLRKLPEGAGIVNLTVQGVFSSGETYGHENGYRYQIVADKISEVKVLQKGIKSRQEQETVEKRWGCGGTDPK